MHQAILSRTQQSEGPRTFSGALSGFDVVVPTVTSSNKFPLVPVQVVTGAECRCRSSFIVGPLVPS